MTLSILLPGGHQPKTYKRLDAAKEFADLYSLEHSVELEVIDNESLNVMYVATPVRDRIFHPWERVETPKFSSPHFEGWRPAYTRKRIEATVYRSYDPENTKPWRVYDGRTKAFVDVANTKEACKVTKEMRHGRML